MELLRRRIRSGRCQTQHAPLRSLSRSFLLKLVRGQGLLSGVLDLDHFTKGSFAKRLPYLVCKLEGKVITLFRKINQGQKAAIRAYISLEERRRPNRSDDLPRHPAREHGLNRSSLASDAKKEMSRRLQVGRVGERIAHIAVIVRKLGVHRGRLVLGVAVLMMPVVVSAGV